MLFLRNAKIKTEYPLLRIDNNKMRILLQKSSFRKHQSSKLIHKSMLLLITLRKISKMIVYASMMT
jgi:hypothetical protein